jgi:hypothetical protein
VSVLYYVESWQTTRQQIASLSVTNNYGPEHRIYNVMTILYTNGCSYTANKVIEEPNRYPSIVAGHYGWQLIDRSHPGSCNERIIRCAMRDCVELLDQPEPVVALIQVTHLARTEYAGESTENTKWKYWQDPLFASIKPNEPGLPREVEEYLKLHMKLFNQQASMVKLMVLIAGLTNFFQHHNIEYLIYNGPEDCNKFAPEEFYEFLSKDPRVLDLKTFNMLQLTGKQQHPDQQGMQDIADYMITAIKQRLSIAG